MLGNHYTTPYKIKSLIKQINFQMKEVIILEFQNVVDEIEVCLVKRHTNLLLIKFLMDVETLQLIVMLCHPYDVKTEEPPN